MIGEILNYAVGSMKINSNALQRPESYDSKKARTTWHFSAYDALSEEKN